MTHDVESVERMPSMCVNARPLAGVQTAVTRDLWAARENLTY